MNQAGNHLSPHAREYLRTVRDGLTDLPVDDRIDLIDQVEQRLHDLGGDGSPAALEAQLERPADLVAELRAAAGFPPATAAPPGVSTTLDTARAVLGHPRVRPVVDYLASLRPAWWAFRGYVLVAAVLAALSHGGGYRLHTLGSYAAAGSDSAPVHHGVAWLLIPVGAVVASVVLGRLHPRLPRVAQLAIVALDVVGVVILIAYPTWWMGPAFAYYSGFVS